MAITTTEEQKKRLRAYLSPYIKGPVTDAILEALATGNAAYLINNVRAVNDQLYVVSAVGRYLDERLADAGITRPPAVGLSDDVFRQIGIEVKNRKQVRDLINQLLNAIFGDEYVRATDNVRQVEPYNLQDGDTLIINFDDSPKNVTVQFETNDFVSIAAAKAQEVADAITKSLRNQGLSGTAIAKDDGNGFYVQLISDTIGPASSVTVLGGRAQNELQFDAPVPAGGNMSTQWNLSLQPGGIIRFTWTGGASPQLGKVTEGNYVNIYGGGFASSSNEGSYTIVNVQGGPVGTAFFEVENPLGSSGVIVQGIDDAILFYDPVRKTLASRLAYAAVYQTQAKLLQIFLPAATKVIRRDRIGSAHLHDPYQAYFTLNAQPASGDIFSVTASLNLNAGADFAIGASVLDTVQNLVDRINQEAGFNAIFNGKTATIIVNDQAIVLTATYTGSASIIASGPLGDPISLAPNQEGPYMYDLSQPFTVGSIGTKLAQDLDGSMSRVVQVDDASAFPDQQGYLILGYGTQEQEGPIPYIARPSSTTLLISPAYTIKRAHELGSDVAFVSAKSPAVVSRDGLDYPFYITDVVSGRIYAQDLINSIAATGINIVFTILYPNDIGLGKWGTVYTENPVIWGE